MEWLEGEAMATATMECKPKLWKRYVDDVLEIIKEGQVENLTNHLNTIDHTNNIKITRKPEVGGKIPFLDMLITKRRDGTVQLCVYRKKTHMDQCLSFTSDHRLNQKLGVVRTLLDRCNNIMTEQDNKIVEEKHITQALKNCCYPR